MSWSPEQVGPTRGHARSREDQGDRGRSNGSLGEWGWAGEKRLPETVNWNRSLNKRGDHCKLRVTASWVTFLFLLSMCAF